MAFWVYRFAAKEAAIKAHPHRHLTFHDIIITKAAELDQIERELLQQGLPSTESSSSSGSGSGSKTFTGSTTGPTTKVDPKNIIPEDRLFDQQLETIEQRHHVFEGSSKGPTTPVDKDDIMPEDEVFDYKLETDKPGGYDRPKSKSFAGSTKGPTTPVDPRDVMPEDRVFDYKLETDKPNGSNGKPRSFTGSTTGPTTPVDTSDVIPEDQVFDYHLETDKPNGSNGSTQSRSFTGSTTGPTTPVDPRDVMPEDRVFDYKLETDKPDSESNSGANDTTLARRRTTVPQEAAPGRARLGSGPPVAIIRGAKEGAGGDENHQVALISISHDGDYATATCVGFDAGSMVKGGLGWMISR